MFATRIGILILMRINVVCEHGLKLGSVVKLYCAKIRRLTESRPLPKTMGKITGFPGNPKVLELYMQCFVNKSQTNYGS